MQFLIAVSLTAIALTLAYKLIERRHKLLILKSIGGALLLGATGAGILWTIQRRAEGREIALQASVTIVYAPDSAQAIVASNPWRKYGGVADTLTSLPFKICNNSTVSISSITFTPKTRITGRSTEYDVIVPRVGEYAAASSLSSDYVLAPSQCTSLSWSVNATSRIVVRDTVYAGEVHAARAQ